MRLIMFRLSTTHLEKTKRNLKINKTNQNIKAKTTEISIWNAHHLLKITLTYNANIYVSYRENKCYFLHLKIDRKYWQEILTYDFILQYVCQLYLKNSTYNFKARNNFIQMKCAKLELFSPIFIILTGNIDRKFWKTDQYNPLLI